MNERIRQTDPTSQGKQKDYDQSDVEHLMRMRAWNGWDDLIGWLRSEGDRDNELTPARSGT